MKKPLLILSACFLILFSCNPSQKENTEETVDSLQQEMEAEMDTAAQKIDSLGEDIRKATDTFLDEAGKTLEEAGEKLKDTSN